MILDTSPVRASRQRYGVAEQMPRHRHRHGYAALVLSGAYLESGDSGRLRVEAGSVLFHDAFDAHGDRFCAQGAEILNLPLTAAPPFALGRCRDPDAVVRAAEADPGAAVAALIADCSEAEAATQDWPDLLAAELREGAVRIAQWAADHALTPSSVSRGFRLAFGVTPQRYRLEVRAATAARAIVAGGRIAEVGFATGFADQPHLSRTLRALYQLTPRQLRATANCVQDRRPADR